ncbi:hypothetical protein [Novosphingobium sp. KACC 22771]|uniref:hypothetical protein n=1 Tax=Novosphingobium sp. KACC 22771 TaxID=3025670 RepID=UPI002365B2DC|nr:hypothetical protein [Novosphingobium sp. KACC 22771]WDF72859.1 hypothetical protein PQ467_02115 [Novosphingobium sp. KACC 22771]
MTPIKIPSGYITPSAMTFSAPDNSANFVSSNSPLPVTTVGGPTTPLAGEASSSISVGPYVPAIGRSVILALSGTWQGNVSIERSTDGGITSLPITIGGAPSGIFSSNCCEAIWDESEVGAQLYLRMTIISGTIKYRVAQ